MNRYGEAATERCATERLLDGPSCVVKPLPPMSPPLLARRTGSTGRRLHATRRAPGGGDDVDGRSESAKSGPPTGGVARLGGLEEALGGP